MGYSFAAWDLRERPESQNIICDSGGALYTIPAGWMLAPDDSTSKAVIAMYPWATDWMSVASGNRYVYRTAMGGSEAGSSSSGFSGYRWQYYIGITYTYSGNQITGYYTENCYVRYLLRNTYMVNSRPYLPSCHLCICKS
jgi:hypothetical protein